MGAAGGGTGLFALQGVARFNLLCIPPLTRERDVGLWAWLVGARLGRDRQALLLVDPPASWTSAPAALDALRVWPFRSDSAVMYYPRVQAFDRLRGRIETFGSCGAAAGMIARSDEARPVWAAAQGEEAILRPRLRPAGAGCHADRGRLAHAGRDTPPSGPNRSPPRLSPPTLGPGR